MKTKIFLIFFAFCLFTFHSFGQTELAFVFVDGSGNPVTGLTDANIKFKAIPYTGSYMTGLTVTEHGTQGNYKVTGFTTFQLVKCYINDIEQTWLGQIQSGDAGSTFLPLTGGTMTGVINMGTQRIEALADPNSSDDAFPLSYGDARYAQNSAAEVITGTWSFDQATFASPYISSTITVPSSDMLIWKAYADANYMSSSGLDSVFVIRDNRIIVDQKLANDITGKQYNDIKSAVDWVYSNGSPGATNRWTVYIIPSPNYYVTDFTWYDYIDIIGLGEVYIKNTEHTPPYSIFTRSGSVGVKAENLNFYSYDANLNIQKIRSHNCNFRVELDNYSPILNIEDSQIKNSGFYIIGGATLTVTGANRIINCYGNTSPSWTASDKIYNYSYVIGDDIQY